MNTMAVLSLVMAFTFAPLGILFGIMAKREIARTGEEGDSLATAGLWISCVFTGFVVLGILTLFVFVAFALGGAAVGF
jgi:hypothetical protein